MITADNIDTLNEAQLRQTVQLLMSELRHKTALVDKLTHEMKLKDERATTQPSTDGAAPTIAEKTNGNTASAR